MTRPVKQEYNFNEFMEVFFSKNRNKENIPSTPQAVGISISENALTIINKTIRKSVNLNSRRIKASSK